jgi:hypothetical protein
MSPRLQFAGAGVRRRHWIIVTPLAPGVPSMIHALASVGKTTTMIVVVFLLAATQTSLRRCFV